MNKPILKCDLHDYLEIACLYEIEVLLVLTNGKKITGLPKTTRIGKENSKSKEEYLEFLLNHDRETTSIPLLSLKTMQAILPNQHFDCVRFIAEHVT